MPLYRFSKFASVFLMALAIVCSIGNGYRDLVFLNNPTGLAINSALVVFLIGGIAFIVKDQRRRF